MWCLRRAVAELTTRGLKGYSPTGSSPIFGGLRSVRRVFPLVIALGNFSGIDVLAGSEVGVGPFVIVLAPFEGTVSGADDLVIGGEGLQKVPLGVDHPDGRQPGGDPDAVGAVQGSENDVPQVGGDALVMQRMAEMVMKMVFTNEAFPLVARCPQVGLGVVPFVIEVPRNPPGAPRHADPGSEPGRPSPHQPGAHQQHPEPCGQYGGVEYPVGPGVVVEVEAAAEPFPSYDVKGEPVQDVFEERPAKSRSEKHHGGEYDSERRFHRRIVPAVANVPTRSPLLASKRGGGRGGRTLRGMARQTFRANAVVVIGDGAGNVLGFQRSDHPESWQFPQGGIDQGEDPLQAAFRELHEETGIEADKVRLIAEHPDWLAYEFPPGSRRSDRGQVQKWFLIRAPKGLMPDLAAARDDEFCDAKWMRPKQLVERVPAFKRDVYKKALKHFRTRHGV